MTDALTSNLADSQDRQPSRFRRVGLSTAIVLSGFAVLLSAYLWGGEEPSRARTYAVFCAGFFFGTVMILIGCRQRVIANAPLWVIALSIKLLITSVICYHVWWISFEPDLLRVPDGLPGVQDSNVYDYHAFQAAQQGLLNSASELNFTWLSFGVTGYLATIYTLFGISVVYVGVCNCILSLLGFIMLSGTLGAVFGANRRWQYLALGMFIPSLAFYDATPSKEPLTHAFCYSALYFITVLAWTKGRFRLGRGLLLCVSFLSLAVIRANVAVMFAAANAWPIAKRIGLVKATLIALTLGVASLGVFQRITGTSVATMFNLETFITATQSTVEGRAQDGESGLKMRIAQALAPRSAVHLALWSPVRPILWFYLPFPMIVPDFQGFVNPSSDPYQARLDKVGSVHELCFVLAGWVRIWATPYLLGLAWAVIKGRLPSGGILLANLIVPSTLIGNLMFLMGRRYQILVEPLVLAAALVGISFNLGRNLRWPIYFFFGMGVLVVAIMR